MAKADFALRVVAKSALLWLTAAILFASVFGALFSARPSGPSLIIADTVLEDDAVMASNEVEAAN
ncbi:hypothetical protein [Maricaulis parjimensis]|uniref:hypothetical protein n=1 Tax=Maricaulis parjimensis TaxID=144023 RepID=UPI001939D69A|nr:hypothetical protein [Maricaulis parjimensis]